MLIQHRWINVESTLFQHCVPARVAPLLRSFLRISKGADSEGVWVVQSNPLFTQNLNFSWEVFENLINLEYHIYPKYSQQCLFTYISLQQSHFTTYALRKHAYSNILKFSPPKNWKILDKKTLTFFIFLLKNIDCGYSLEPPHRGGSNEYPQSMFLSRNKKNNAYPCKPQFYYIKVGFKGVKII